MLKNKEPSSKKVSYVRDNKDSKYKKDSFFDDEDEYWDDFYENYSKRSSRFRKQERVLKHKKMNIKES